MRTRVFGDEISQAVFILKEFEFDVDEVEIFRRGDELVLRKPVESGNGQDLFQQDEPSSATKPAK